MMNLSLYTVSGFLIMDTDGQRVLAQYYHPKGHPNGESKKLATLKDQRSFENGLFQKTKKDGDAIILYDSHLAVYKHSLDLIFYLICDPSENELMVNSALVAFFDALRLLLRDQVEKRAVLENLDVVLLCLDETIDDGVILDTDSVAISSRVSRARPDATDIVINEQTIKNAYQSVKERMQQTMGQF